MASTTLNNKTTLFYTRQILLLSGIGDAKHLKSNDIPVVVDLPGVGQKLTDHPIVDMYYKTKSDARSIRYLRPESLKERFKLLLAVIQYLIPGLGGPMAMNVRSFLPNDAFYR
jgi:choline dehydrogenase